MGTPSYVPARITAYDEDDSLIARPRAVLRLSRMPTSHAVIAKPMPLVAETFRRLGTEPPGRSVNDDEVSEDELFAIWQARLL